MRKIYQIKKLITNTPLVAIKYKFNGTIKTAYAKLEWFSLTGSIKDKVAYQILIDAYKQGQLKSGQPIIEVSSGNMGISICAVANLLGNPCTILMPKNMSEERKKLIRLYGATLIETYNFQEAFRLCENYKNKGYFCPKQFSNQSNTLVHEEITAMEILNKIGKHPVETFVAGVGTSGTLSGVSKILKKYKNIKTIAIEPENARIISNKKPYHQHQLQGLSDEILPDLFNYNLCDNIIQINDYDAIAMSQKLCEKLSLGVGISSGANFLGCVLSKTNAITIFPDDNKKYLTTNLSKKTSSSLVDSIELLSINVL